MRQAPSMLNLLSTRQQLSPPPLEIESLLGPLIIGSWLSWMLLGTLIVQIYWYNNRYPRDRVALKALVYSLVLIELLQTIITSWSTWDLVFGSWGDASAFKFVHPPRHIATVPIFSSIVGVIVQTFYAWRIWTVGNHTCFRSMSIFIVAIAFVQFITCSIGSIQLAFIDPSKLHSLRWAFSTWLVASFACDVLIAVSMLLILNKAKAHSRGLTSSVMSSRTESILDRLIRQTVETGAITALCTGVELVLYLVDEGMNAHLTPAYVLGKLYTNCLVAMLNSRNPISGWGTIFNASENRQRSFIGRKRASANVLVTTCTCQSDELSSGYKTQLSGNGDQGIQDTGENVMGYEFEDATDAVLRIHDVERETMSHGSPHQAK